MSKQRRIFVGLICGLIMFAVLLLTTATAASTPGPPKPRAFEPSLVKHLRPSVPFRVDSFSLAVPGDDLSQVGSGFNASIRAQQVPTTTLTVNIISSPWAVLDHNDPGGVSEEVPNVFIVEAVITNTGTFTATDLLVNLDYNEDPINNWILLSGEDPDRTIDELAPQTAYHVYWFARYSIEIGASHQYTVTAEAVNASPVATSDNYYGELDPGETVETRGFQSTGNSGAVQSSAEVMVGVAFTVTVQYDLGQNPRRLVLSPVGNVDFDPSAYRLVESVVRLYNDAETQESVVTDRLYLPTLPSFADNAHVTYTFMALTPSNTRLCSYTGVVYQSTDHYDQFFCEDVYGTTLPITGTLALSMTKQASSATVQQGQSLTYTIDYTNTATRPLNYAWVWDDVDAAIGSIITTTIAPPSDPDATTDSRVAWYLGEIQPDSTGAVTFEFLVDGDGQDLDDNTAAVNHAFFGINQGTLPANAALTSTITTIAQAPAITLNNTDGQATTEPGDALTYTLRVTNSGSITATGLVITDVLPAEVNYTALDATPDETSLAGQVLVWNNLGPIPPNDGTVVITIPVTVDSILPNGTILDNTMMVKYENPVGWVYAAETAMDTTTVNAPVLTISKSDFPDPALTGRMITYTLHYTNSGPAAATNVLITDVVPLSTTYETCSGGETCGESNGVVSWTIGTVPGNTNATTSFSVRVSDTLETGTLIHNEDYGIVADQTNFIPGTPVATLIERDKATIEGYTFVDADGDGERDAGEMGIPGVTVTLDGTTTTTTGLDGHYVLTTTVAGTHTVVETDLPGYFSTTSNEVHVEVSIGNSYQVDFGDALISTSDFATIYGTVFEDMDGDGEWDADELGIPGVTVTLDGLTTATTDLYGNYTLFTDMVGSHTAVETDLPGYFSTTSNEVHVEVSMGNSYQVDFGDALTSTSDFATIHGTVFEDIDGDGEWDAAELGIAGVTVTLDGLTATTTDLYGNYTLLTTVAGTHTVVETDLPGYFSTTSNEVHVEVNVGNSYQVDFGDALASTSDFAAIYGTAFKDADGDGEWDADELGIPGVTVTLDGITTATTDLYGNYTLFTDVAGSHTVVETDLPGYFSTTPNEVHVEASMGNSYQVDFGDALISTSDFATIYGTVFKDADGDGERDADELGIPGVTVTLDGITTATTDLYGNYTLLTDVAGVHTVVETDPPGYFSTTSNEVHVEASMGHSYQVDFGDALTSTSDFATIYGTVFEDANSDEEWDADELGIAGVTVTLDGLRAAITDLYGNYTLLTTVAGSHTVVETDPPFYSSTTSNIATLTVELGQGYRVDFGDVASASCVCQPDIYEEDDVTGQAVSLNVGVSQSHDFCNDATDWTTFTAQAGSVYTITTSSWGQRADTFLALFDSDARTPLAANDDYDGTTDYSSRIVWQAPANRVYYVRTTNRGGLTRCETEYEVQIDQLEMYVIYLPLMMRNHNATVVPQLNPAGVGPTGVINHTCPDVYEPDDTWQQAQAIEPGTVQVHSFDSDPTYYAADKDFAWFDIKDQQTITFTTTPMTNTLTLLELYDEHGTALDDTGAGQLVWTAPAAGNYYLSASPRTTTFGCADAVGYNLLVEKEPIRVIYLPIVMRNLTH